MQKLEIHSSVGRQGGKGFSASSSGYQQLQREYVRSGLTYKSNQILHKMAESHPRHYPYDLLLHIAKTFHFNQFEIIFFSHILNDGEPCYNTEPELFNDDIEISPTVAKIIERILQHRLYSNQVEQYNIIIRQSQVLQQEVPFADREFTAAELRRIYAYLLVLGYAVKYYLNEQMVIKPYDEEIKLRHPSFFATIFNRWAKKYGNSVLATTPRKINAYYFELAAQLEVDDLNAAANNEDNCQYRNYNEIVEELIKATTEVEDAGQFEKEPPEE